VIRFCRFARLMSGVIFCIPFAWSTAAAQFEIRSQTPTDQVPNSVVAADFNRDGKMDMAVSSAYSPYEVQVFLGKGDGTFGPPTGYNVGLTGGSLAAADLNGDGNPDLVVVNGCPDNVCFNTVSVLLGNGDGTFQAPVTYSTPPEPIALLLGDFNNDGKLDIAVLETSETCACVSVLLGNGDGTFQEPAIVTELPGGGEALAAGHFTSSKNLDLAVSSRSVQILLGNGDGTFTLGKSFGGFDSPMSIVAGDFRNNGKTDLAVADFEGGLGFGDIDVLLGNGDGSFEDPVVYPIFFPIGIAAGDLNGDGILDLVSGTLGLFGGSGIAVLRGNGDGTFQPAVLYPAGEFPEAVAVADFNGDHMPDITMADGDSNREYVYMNTGVVNFSPDTVLHVPPSPAQSVTLTNNGTAALAISSISVTPHYQLSETCGSSVAPGAKCSISVAFDTKTTPQKGTVKIVDSASTKPQEIGLTATSVALSVDPMNFAPQTVGTASTPMTLTLTNEGNVYLLFFDVSIFGSGFESFSFTGGSNCTDAALYPGESCSVSVTFKPTKTGVRTATIKFIDTGLGSPEGATLTGIGK
jgi:FG-GAP-like repeat